MRLCCCYYYHYYCYLGKRQLGRNKYQQEDNIRMDLKEKGFENVHWTHLAHIRQQWQALMNMAKNNSVPS
jgi:hypothetical protein